MQWQYNWNKKKNRRQGFLICCYYPLKHGARGQRLCLPHLCMALDKEYFFPLNEIHIWSYLIDYVMSLFVNVIAQNSFVNNNDSFFWKILFYNIGTWKILFYPLNSEYECKFYSEIDSFTQFGGTSEILGPLQTDGPDKPNS